MFGAITPTVIGNLTGDPELFFTKKGDAGVKFTIACNERYFDKEANRYKDLPTVYLTCTAWRELAEHISDTLRRGMGVIAYGRLNQSTYTLKDTGEKRTVMEMTVDVIGPSLQFATAVVTKTATRPATVVSEPMDDPWGGAPEQDLVAVGAGASSAPEDDEPPF